MRWQYVANNHPPLLYSTPKEFEEHMIREHAGTFPSEQLQSIVDMSAMPLEPVLEHCPFCPVACDNIDMHIGQHLQQFALRSLPPLPEDEWQSSESEGVSEKTLSYQHDKVAGEDQRRRNYLDDLNDEPESPRSPVADIPSTPPSSSGSDADMPDWVATDIFLHKWLEVVTFVRKEQQSRYQNKDDPILVHIRNSQVMTPRRNH
jgi:hypothetical protein